MNSIIDNILNNHFSDSEKLDYLINTSPIILNEVFGSTYQSSFRKNDQIYEITHTIDSLKITKTEILANITLSNDFIRENTKSIDGIVLRPVYYNYTDDENDKSSLLLATFDLDLNITFNSQ